MRQRLRQGRLQTDIVEQLRNLILDLLGQERVWDEKRFARYDRGSAPIADDTDAAPWSEILADLDRSQERIRAGIAALTPEALAAPLPADKNPFNLDSVSEMLSAFNFHEAYHAGQTGILRRVLGKEGVIN